MRAVSQCEYIAVRIISGHWISASLLACARLASFSMCSASLFHRRPRALFPNSSHSNEDDADVLLTLAVPPSSPAPGVGLC